MILTAHQPAYLPWAGLFHKIALADKFVFFDQVQYVPKDFISRNYIKSPNGPLLLTVPVLTKGHREKKISGIEINNSERWASKHWRSILANYRNAPYFSRYSGFFEEVYQKEWKFLSDLNFYMLNWFLETLKITVPVEKAESYIFEGRKSDLVLDMCVQLKADVYVFGSMGKEYADEESFKRKNIIPYFQQYHHPVYRQQYGTFIPNLSVADLLFNEGDNSFEILMSGNVDKNSLKNRTSQNES